MNLFCTATPLILATGLSACAPAAVDHAASEGSDAVAELSLEVARHAVTTYAADAVTTLADLVQFETYEIDGIDNIDNPEFELLTTYLENKAAELGFDFENHGPVLILGLGSAAERIGVVAHADVQPADPDKWASSPFVLDTETEPGHMLGRGTEDDKGPLACALFAMKALADQQLDLARRIELIVTLTEESDWDPIREFLKVWEPPSLNVAFDADYPVVIAEKGWGEITVTVPVDHQVPSEPHLVAFSGGSFLSQIPEDASAIIQPADIEIVAALRRAATAISTGDSRIRFRFDETGAGVEVHATGVSAHSATPWHGANAITHLAAVLGAVDWPDTAAARLVRLTNSLVGTGDYAEKFGSLAHSHPFMGPLTLTLAKIESTDAGWVAGLSYRRPIGKSHEEVEGIVSSTLDDWILATGFTDVTHEQDIHEPYLVEDAPHVPVFLSVFRHYSGITDAEPVAIGGGTNASLLPNGVSFGPSMPGVLYTGHSEHEFISRQQFELNLEMYTAALAELTLTGSDRN